MKSKKVNVSLSLDWDIVEKLKKLAEEDDRALSSCINLILRDYLREREKQ
ncbi:toxin-antitoxin system protein [uncultured Dysosmobacter sp.]|nr:toxin-antitoxin system protein [uncultured Dysosmobacter sp.]